MLDAGTRCAHCPRGFANRQRVGFGSRNGVPSGDLQHLVQRENRTPLEEHTYLDAKERELLDAGARALVEPRGDAPRRSAQRESPSIRGDGS